MRRSRENGGQGEKPLLPVPMYAFWGEVTLLVNKKLVADYKSEYIPQVHRGIKHNKEVEEVIDDCVKTILSQFKEKGLRPRHIPERLQYV